MMNAAFVIGCVVTFAAFCYSVARSEAEERGISKAEIG